MNWTVFGVGIIITIAGLAFLTRSKKGAAAFLGVFLGLVGGWFALTAIDYGSRPWALLVLSIVWFIIVAVLMVKAPSDATTLVGLAFAVLGVFALAQTDPVSSWHISSYLGDALDVAKRTWQSIFNSGTK